jgi:hypothetical protein
MHIVDAKGSDLSTQWTRLGWLILLLNPSSWSLRLLDKVAWLSWGRKASSVMAIL